MTSCLEDQVCQDVVDHGYGNSLHVKLEMAFVYD